MSTPTDPAVETPIPELSHIAFVVDDLEAAMDRYGRLLGVEPWFLYRYEPPRLTETTYRGEPQAYTMRVAVSDVEGPIDLSSRLLPTHTLQRVVGALGWLRDRLGLRRWLTDPQTGRGKPVPNPGLPGVNIELIEPVEGPSTYTEHLASNGHGIHHVGCFAYDDPYAALEMYTDLGVEVLQSGRFEGLEFWYLDLTRELDGLILEIAANLWAIPEPDGVYPA